MNDRVVKSYIIKSGEQKVIAEYWKFDQPGQARDYVMKAVVEPGGNLELIGKIQVTKKARGTETFLRQKVLLLGEGARAITKPELEIETQEVKAGHAASIGQVDEEQLFYLMSRGLSKKEATKLLVEAFLHE